MSRGRNRRLWCLALAAVALLASTAAALVGAEVAPAAGIPPAAASVSATAPDAAVLPARLADEVRAAGQAAPLRVVVLAAVLAGLVGLPAVARRRSSAAAHGSQPLRARRHSIALRAPPLQFA